ncbi:hypothetical protein [Streptomyces sp. NPDC016845]|uniref:hypothetical protein n=1 Tax=Streptomyces sp. NPDC016845 TaxID=3364972 RepID=UPI0037930915
MRWDAVLAEYRETDDGQNQQRLVGMAEELYYKGSWDGAIDAALHRQHFLQAAAEALGLP